MSQVISLLMIVCLSLVSGCTWLADTLVPPHDRSLKSEPEIACLHLEQGRKEFGFALLAPLAGELISWAIDRTSKELEKEAGRYKATYSARATGSLLVGQNKKLSLKLMGLRFTRYYGPDSALGCEAIEAKLAEVNSAKATGELVQEPNVAKAFELVTDVKLSQTATTIEVRPTQMTIGFAKAKIASFPAWPHRLWRWVDSSAGKMDINARVSINVVNETKTKVEQDEVMNVDIPLGRITMTNEEQKVALDVTSGWAALPRLDGNLAESAKPVDLVPVTVTVTITEADSMGDVIADAGKNLSNNKSNIQKGLLKAMGLNGEK